MALALLREGNNLPESLTGGVGNDTIIGGGGVDTLTGGLGFDRFIFSDIPDSDLIALRVTDIITDYSVEDLLQFELEGAAGLRVRGNYNSVQSFARAADQLLDGKVKIVFGIVGRDGYVAVDADGSGITHLVQLVGVTQVPSIIQPDS